MKFENTKVFNFEGAMRGMRNPLNSWAKSDSRFEVPDPDDPSKTIDMIGDNDLNLAMRLINSGDSSDRKFLRQIMVCVDITAPLYWFKEFDTYKVGTVANSTSTMHKIASTPITLDCFETDDLDDTLEVDDSWYHVKDYITDTIISLEALRKKYNETKDKKYWKELVRWLPEGWLQTRTVTLNYENLKNMYRQRKHHKLTEWSEAFCGWVKTLPYAHELIIGEEKTK